MSGRVSLGSFVPTSGSSRTIAVGVGDLAVAADASTALVARALGSCIAVCIWDPAVRVAGILHFLLPESSGHAARRRTQPSAFADSGIPLLLDAAGRHGFVKSRAVVRLVGGARLAESPVTAFHIGRRNVLAARTILRHFEMSIDRDLTGGVSPRSVTLSPDSGRLTVRTGTDCLVIE